MDLWEYAPKDIGALSQMFIDILELMALYTLSF